ncbi:hypothetical protein ART_0163 [Arthrobacter sp. PAMC 25486]|uniref:hypothetical protein n=1 Tax=Arthrobacter sp. PAMC 25486 TaxID=1494608 RepID=UPI0005360131|nr:hypothetical protein [Arthrobacter sp. PAMC 25486]AIX99761.1 hypothetical protein ART_0163 [Arthrobacter sp. PAMC 25486]
MKPSNMGTGRVVGQFGIGRVDGPDVDNEPEVVPLSGSITFTPSVPYFPNRTSSPNPITVLTAPITAVLDYDGYVCTPAADGVTPLYRGIQLFATDDPDMSVENWTYSVVYRFNAVNGAAPTIKAHSMALPEGAEIDLTKAVEVPSSPGVGTPQALALLAEAEAAASASAQSARVAMSVRDDADAGLFDGKPGPPGDPLNQAGADFMVKNYDFLTGWDRRAPILGGDGHLFVATDRTSRETWIGARREDGGPTDLSLWHMQNRLGIHQHADASVSWAVLDAAWRYTEMQLNNDGNVPDEVLRRWASRMGAATGSGLAVGDRYVNSDSSLSPVFPDVKNITIWGSSSAERIGTALAAALAGTGATFHNEGKGAETSQHISARLGSVPASLTVSGGSIPASGAVTVTAANMPNSAEMKPFTGTLNGVRGTLSSTSTVFSFTRTTAGAATPVTSGTAFIPIVGTASRQHVTLLWTGKNNLSGAGSAPLVTDQTHAAFNYLSPLVKRVLVLGHFVDTAQTSGSTQWTNVRTVNAALAALYGDLFLDVDAYLCSPQLWVDTGISPTPTDLQHQADGIKPPSIAHDSGHMNAAGYTSVSALIRTKLISLGWY